MPGCHRHVLRRQEGRGSRYTWRGWWGPWSGWSERRDCFVAHQSSERIAGQGPIYLRSSLKGNNVWSTGRSCGEPAKSPIAGNKHCGSQQIISSLICQHLDGPFWRLRSRINCSQFVCYCGHYTKPFYASCNSLVRLLLNIPVSGWFTVTCYLSPHKWKSPKPEYFMCPCLRT